MGIAAVEQNGRDTVAKFIKRTRKERQLTQRQLARAMDYDDSYISKMERGKEPPSREFLERFVAAMGLGAPERDYLFYLADRIPPALSRLQLTVEELRSLSDFVSAFI